MNHIYWALEGNTEWNLLVHLPSAHQASLKSIPLPRTSYVDNLGRPVASSGDTVATKLKLGLQDPSKTVVIVICDAESQPPSVRWKNLRSVLLKEGFEDLPTALPNEGAVLTDSAGRKVGVWIMPNNFDRGMIEDFYLSTIPDEDVEKQLALGFVDAIPNPKFKRKTKDETEKVKSKAVLGVWLSIQRDPVLFPGVAFQRKWIKKEDGPVPVFLHWLNRLLDSDDSN